MERGRGLQAAPSGQLRFNFLGLRQPATAEKYLSFPRRRKSKPPYTLANNNPRRICGLLE